ncbi:MAG: hypothetical protein JNK56_38885 [Myxococcales bacterium]|nr:hypothetical protein [Myxococcales bacterium]
MRFAWQPLLLALAVAACETREAENYPDVIAASKYIEYSTWADATDVCMDKNLAALDRFIATTATFIGVDPPNDKIRYLWIPESVQTPDNWTCPLNALGCFNFGEQPNSILAETLDLYHEFVHAVAFAALGPTHQVLSEGLAEYLGKPESITTTAKDFEADFTAMLGRSPIPDDYRLAMHYVGSCIEQHGINKFKDLMHRVPMDATFDAFAAAHQSVYGESLTVSLARMTAPIHGQIPDTCAGEELPWGDGPNLELTIHGECGDDFFYSGGSVADEYQSYKRYLVDVPTAGPYALQLEHAGQPALAFGDVRSCPGVEFGSTYNLDGEAGFGSLNPGLHQLTIGFPPGSGPTPELELRLTYEGTLTHLPATPRTLGE